MGHFASLITTVLFPVYSMVQNDKSRLKRGFYLSISLVSLVTIPSMVCLFFAGKRLIPFVYGPVWTGSITSLQILCVCGALTSIYTVGDTLSRAKGLVYAKLIRNSIHAIVVVIGALVGVNYGIEGVAVAGSIATFIMYLMVMQLGKNIIEGAWDDILKAHIPGAMIGIFTAVFSGMVLFAGDEYGFPDSLVLLILVFVLILTYLFSFIFFPVPWLGEIPEFLLNKGSSFLPQRVLAILNKRFRAESIEQFPNRNCAG
jgi:O-antigen/teichoic acid export membrane protein